MPERFQNREEGGKALAELLKRNANHENAVVLALPRGGLPVAFEVAEKLDLPLDVLAVRKLGVPGQKELAFGAIALGGVTVFNEDVLAAIKIPDAMIEDVIERERKELIRRERVYRGDKPVLKLKDKTVLIVDDGLATGATMKAAVAAVKTQEPRQIIVAAPVAAPSTCREFEDEVGECCVCVITPEPLYGVGMWYRDFGQTTDDEVCRLLDKAWVGRAARVTANLQ